MDYNNVERVRKRRNFWSKVNGMPAKQSPPKSRRKPQRLKSYELVIVVVFFALISLAVFIFTAGLVSGNQDFLSAAQRYAQQTRQAMQSEPTPTPFQPLGNGSDMADSPAVTPNPTGEQSTLPTPAFQKLQKPEGQVNILLLGSDVRPDSGGFRTDIIVWVSLNPRGGFVSAVSFPRDLWVQIPGRGENRINTAFPVGDFELLADTFEVNFGVRPDSYVLIDFQGFVSVINSLNGIDVQTAKNLTDSCATWVNPSGMCSVGPGLVHMNGDLALWYARSRYSTNDIERGRRAQEVIEAIFDRFMSLDAILMAPEIYETYTTYVQTDITLKQVISLLPLASKINQNADIRNHVIGYDLVYDWITIQGAQVLVPDKPGIHKLMIDALQWE